MNFQIFEIFLVYMSIFTGSFDLNIEQNTVLETSVYRKQNIFKICNTSRTQYGVAPLLRFIYIL